jgi:hypothetical protein
MHAKAISQPEQPPKALGFTIPHIFVGSKSGGKSVAAEPMQPQSQCKVKNSDAFPFFHFADDVREN